MAFTKELSAKDDGNVAGGRLQFNPTPLDKAPEGGRLQVFLPKAPQRLFINNEVK
jgi:hypothetical protein